MRTLAIGDIHGCFTALATLEQFVPFRADDLIVTLGDYVDRGPDSRLVLDWLIAREETGLLVAIKGNHDLMMLDARHDGDTFEEWIRQGGDATLRSYQTGSCIATIQNVPPEHYRFLDECCRSWYEQERHFFVHANAYPDMTLAEQPGFMLYWEHLYDPSPHCSGKSMICGHTSQKSGEPLSYGHTICIDTWACGRGWLTCLDVDSGRYWQANQAGQTRGGFLEKAE